MFLNDQESHSVKSLATAHSVTEIQDFITTVRQRSICGRPLQVRIN